MSIGKQDRKFFQKLFMALAALLILAPYLFATAGLAQTKPPQTNQPQQNTGGGVQLSPGALTTDPTVPAQPYDNAVGMTTYVQQAAEQNTQGVITNVNNQLLQGSDLGAYNSTYQGLNKFWSQDIVSNFFQNIGQVIGRWLTEFINGWVSDAAQFLTAFLRTFVLNPNIAVNGLNNNVNGAPNGNDDISPWIRQGADTMYGIAVDLLLLLFILCIWKYWVDAAWRGGVGLMGAVGRLITTAGLLLAWPTIYAFEIQITNEMIQAIYFNSADQVMMLDSAMAAAIKSGLLAGAGLLASAFAPVIGAAAGGALAGGAGGLVLGTVGDIVAFAGLLIYLILGVVLITEIIYILVLKAIQTALLTAQYMFAPIFIVFFATPDTENICSGFVRSFVEVSLWTFVWVGLLKILVIVLFSNFNPWGKIVMAVGVLQLMIQVPAFLARAQISPVSDFVSAGSIMKGLQGGVTSLASALTNRTKQGIDYFTNQKYAARGLPQSQSVELNRLPKTAADQQLYGAIGNTKNGKVQGGQDGTGTMPLGPDGKPIVPPTGPNGNKPNGPPDPKKPGGPTAPNKPITPLGDNDKDKKKDKDKDKDKDKHKHHKPEHAGLVTPPTGNKAGVTDPNNPNATGKTGPTPPKTGPTAPKTGPTAPKTGPTPPKTGPTPPKTAQTPTGTQSTQGPNLNTDAAKNATKRSAEAAAIAALGPALAARTNKDDESRKNERARQQAEQQAQEAKAEANHLKTHAQDGHGHDKEKQEKEAREKAQTLQPGPKKDLATAKDGASEDEKQKKAREQAAALLAQAQPHGKDPKQGLGQQQGQQGQGAQVGKGDGTTAKPVVTTGQPKDGKKGTGPQPPTGNNAGGVVKPVDPKDAEKAAAQAGKGNNLGGQTAQQLTLPGMEQEHEQEQGRDSKDGKGAQDTGRQGVTVRPVLPTGQHHATPPLKGTAEKLNTQGSGSGTDAGKDGKADTTVKGDVKPGAPTLKGHGKPVVPTGAQGAHVDPRTLAQQGKTQQQLHQSGGEKGQQGNDLEVQGDDAVVVPGVGPDGRPVMVRVRPGQTSQQQGPGSHHQAVESQQTQQQANMQGRTSTQVTGKVQPPTKGNPAVAANTGSGATLDPRSLSHQRTQQQLHQAGEKGQQGNDLEVQGDDVMVVPGVGADGRPVMVRVRPGQGAHLAGHHHQTVEAIAAQGGGAPLAGRSGPTPPVRMQGGPAAGNFAAATAAGAASVVAGAALNRSSVTQGRHVDPTTASVPAELQDFAPDDSGSGAPPAQKPDVSPYEKYKQPGYRWVPPRNLVVDIRTAQGPTIGASPSGTPTVVGDAKGHVNHVRFGKDATPEQKSLQMLAAGYATTFSSDSEAFDAARQSAIDAGEDGPRGLGERMAAGILAYNGGSFKQTALAKQRFQRSLLKHAMLGSESYVNGSEGNAFTQYLRTRYGDMTPEQQAWGIHIMADDTSPESGWNPKVGPATESCFQNGIPVTASYRAAASNTAVLKQPAWGRGPAIRGVAAYVDSMVSAQCGPDTHPMVKDALIGRIAPNIKAAEVGACLAIMLESPTAEAGEEACKNPALVQAVAELSSGGHAQDAVSAYRSMATVLPQASRQNSGGGASFRSSSSSTVQQMSAGVAQSVPVGPASVSTAPMSGAGAGSMGTVGMHEQTVEAMIQPGGGPGAGFSSPSVGAPSLGSLPPMPNMQVGQQTNVLFNNRGLGGGMGSTSRHQVDMPVSMQPGAQDVRIVGGSLGGTPPIVRSELDVNARVIGAASGGIGVPNLGNIAGNQQYRQQTDVNVRQGGGQGSIQGGRGQVDVTAYGGGQPTGQGDVTVRQSGNQNTSETIHNQLDVNARTVGQPAGQPAMPSLGQLGNLGGNQQYRQQVDVDVRQAGGQGGIVSGINQSVDLDVDGDATFGGAAVSVSGANGTSETVVQNSYVEGYILPPSQSQQASAINSQDINNAAQRAADSYKANVHYAQQVIMDMHSAGYTDQQIQDPNISRAAMALHRESPAMLGTGAITARIMGSQPNTQEAVQQVHVVEQMIEAGWSANQISRPDVITSQAIIQTGGGYPTPQYVREVRMDKRYYPKPGFAVPQDLAAERLRQRSQGRIDGYLGSQPQDYGYDRNRR